VAAAQQLGPLGEGVRGQRLCGPYPFANAVSEEEARQLYEEFAVPAPGKPLFQAAAANLNP
jgi:hypothetical protein